MENWRRFLGEGEGEKDKPPMTQPLPPEQLKCAEDDEAGECLDPEEIKSEVDKIVPARFGRPYKHSVLFSKDVYGNKDGMIMNAEYIGKNPQKWILGKNSDNPYKDTHFGTTELITAVRAAIENVHKTKDEVYSARLVKMFLGETDTEITERHKKMAIVFQDLGWIPKRTSTLYLEDFSVKPFYKDVYGNTYHGHPKKGKGKIKGHGSHQTGKDADLGFYMLPGFEMKTRFPRNVARGSHIQNHDNANIALGAPPSKAIKTKGWYQFGAMAPSNTYHPKSGMKGINKRLVTKGSVFAPTRDFKARIIRLMKQAKFSPLSINHDPVNETGGTPISEITEEQIIDLLIRDYENDTAQSIVRESRNLIEAPTPAPTAADRARWKREDEEERRNRTKREAYFVRAALMTLTAEKAPMTGKKGVLKSGLFVKRAIGSIDSERTWQLIKGLLDNGAEMVLVDEHLRAVLKGACLRAGDKWSWRIKHSPNHRNHIHVRVYAKKSTQLGKQMNKKLKKTISQTSSILKKIVALHKKDPKIVERFYEEQLKDVPAWKWSNDIIKVVSSGKQSLEAQAKETAQQIVSIIRDFDYITKYFQDRFKRVATDPDTARDIPKDIKN